MHAKTTAHAAETAELLAEFGIELSAGLVVMSDFAKAESAYIHHTASLSPWSPWRWRRRSSPAGGSPSCAWSMVVAKAPSMDGREQRALAAVCGTSVDGLPEGSGRAPVFAAHLVDVIARYQLNAFFTREPDRAINGNDVRPGGIEPRTDAIDPKAMAEWRRAYKALPPVRQMMVVIADVLEAYEARRWPGARCWAERARYAGFDLYGTSV